MGRFDAGTTSLVLLATWFWDKAEVSLAEISHAAEEIDRAPSASELGEALDFLAAHGLVCRRHECFGLTESGLAAVELASNGAGNVIATWQSLERSLAALAAA